MPSYELLISFFVATSIFACVPGPGMLYAAAQTLARGRRAGWLSAMGLHLGGYTHIAAAAFGLAVLLEAVPLLYAVVKFAGAGYLIWLGLKLFASAKPGAASRPGGEAPAPGRAVWQSVIVEVLNPKTALFYLAFLPQFTDLSASLPLSAQILILGAIVNLMFSTTDAACILLSERAARLLAASRSAERLARRLGGGVLVGLGINLAATRQ
jgi:threonine/homoserine/homoserine lactone efflux protein